MLPARLSWSTCLRRIPIQISLATPEYRATRVGLLLRASPTYTAAAMFSCSAASSGHCAGSVGSTNKSRLKPLNFPTTGFQEIDPSVKFEEEKLNYYHPALFYPIHIGEVLNERYQVVSKFGYGSTSTIWLCKDLAEHRYVVLKVFIRQGRMESNRELECFRHFQKFVNHKADHGGHERVRFPEEHFTIQSSDSSTHDVLVLRPLGLSVRALQTYTPAGVFPELNAVLLTQSTVTALDYLRNVHSGNLHLTLTDENVLEQCEQDELVTPSPRKVAKEGVVIHATRHIINGESPLVLCDLSSARICPNHDLQRGLPLMPEHYRPPEVILNMPWGYSVDMWCFGITIWRMLNNKGLFGHYVGTDLDEARHLSLMVGLLGPPPLEFLKRSEKSLKFWDESGSWRGPIALPPPTYTLEAICPKSLDGESKVLFLDFIRKILHWDPDERLCPATAWYHPWVHRIWSKDRLVPIEEWEKSQGAAAE
ncbi:hypothetical protein PpBr36_00028 [Pyricularia pennisetigena]|uniref:hypothetical protein n=1 Tax=Pyricularia pennisetigena TaxID=1578925 RepID=UPI00114E6AC4|nr:hypothetical protein PpBr36_00028 [Pyricularia pennisetigena]TLS29248.1 hypothetical protein PpBr36_00028 [Pyricularia pennisetigena]